MWGNGRNALQMIKKNKQTDVLLNSSSLNQVSRPFMFLSIFLLPVFGSTPSCPVLYLPCPCSDREIHTWRTLSVGYCMFASRHDHIHSALFFNVIFLPQHLVVSKYILSLSLNIKLLRIILLIFDKLISYNTYKKSH